MRVEDALARIAHVNKCHVMALRAITSPPRLSLPGCGQISERILLSTGSGKAETAIAP
jgi:hypothetical protein